MLFPENVAWIREAEGTMFATLEDLQVAEENHLADKYSLRHYAARIAENKK